jgi:hypothetical protein
VLCVDRAKPDVPVVALVQMDSGWESAFYYRQNGQAANGEGRQLDLLPVPKKHKRTVWLLHGRHMLDLPHPFLLREQAEEHWRRWRNDYLQITGPHEIEFTEGEGLGGAEGGA